MVKALIPFQIALALKYANIAYRRLFFASMKMNWHAVSVLWVRTYPVKPYFGIEKGDFFSTVHSTIKCNVKWRSANTSITRKCFLLFIDWNECSDWCIWFLIPMVKLNGCSIQNVVNQIVTLTWKKRIFQVHNYLTKWINIFRNLFHSVYFVEKL